MLFYALAKATSFQKEFTSLLNQQSQIFGQCISIPFVAQREAEITKGQKVLIQKTEAWPFNSITKNAL